MVCVAVVHVRRLALLLLVDVDDSSEDNHLGHDPDEGPQRRELACGTGAVSVRSGNERSAGG